jgi:hypothetical protein
VFRPRQDNATGISDRFDAGSNAYAVAHQIIALHNDVADMDTDAQRQFSITQKKVVKEARRSDVKPPKAPGCVLQGFPTSSRTNWHYECVKAFLEDRIAVQP